MKLMFLIGGLGCGGAPRQFVELVRRMPAHGVDPVVVTVEKSDPGFEHIFDEIGIVHWRLERRCMLDLRVCARIASFCRREQVDAVHTWQPLAGIYGVVAAKLARVPVVCSTVQDSKVKNKPLEWLSKHFQAVASDLFVANNEEGLVAQFGRMRPHFRFIGNGMDVDRLTHVNPRTVEELRRRYRCEGAFNVGMVANLSSFRDPYTFADALGLLLKENRKINGFLIGDGPTQPEAAAYIKQKGLSGHIHVTGMIPSGVENYIALFDAAVLLVNASIIQEGMSNFLMEAMIMKKPVVATRGGGNLSLIRDGETGFLVEPYDGAGLAAVLREIMDHGHAAMGEAASRDIISRFGMDRYVKSYLECYREVLGKGGQRAGRAPDASSAGHRAEGAGEGSR